MLSKRFMDYYDTRRECRHCGKMVLFRIEPMKESHAWLRITVNILAVLLSAGIWLPFAYFIDYRPYYITECPKCGSKQWDHKRDNDAKVRLSFDIEASTLNMLMFTVPLFYLLWLARHHLFCLYPRWLTFPLELGVVITGGLLVLLFFGMLNHNDHKRRYPTRAEDKK